MKNIKKEYNIHCLYMREMCTEKITTLSQSGAEKIAFLYFTFLPFVA